MTRLKRQQNKKAGFTLIELMVATVVFTSIMLASMGSLFVTLNAARNSKAMRLAMDNVNFAMESMTRSIRMGTYYYCVLNGETMPSNNDVTSYQNCSNGGTLIAFVPQKTYSSNRVGYKLTSRTDGSGTHSLQRCDIDGCVDIVSSAVDIEKLLFFVNGSAPLPDTTQASVYIIIKGTVTVKGVPTSFAIQTMASQRNF
ncbi:MAG: type II secretion system protein [Candidatus Paceibacterota bacterium]